MAEAPSPAPGESVGRPSVVKVSCTDIDQARFLLNRFYYPVAVGVPEGPEGFALHLEVIQLGPLTIGHLGLQASSTLIASELDGYHVTLPFRGQVQTRQARHEVLAGPETAVVFRPGNPVYTLHDSHSTELDIKIDGAALEAELSALLGRDVGGPIDLAPAMRLSDGLGRSFRRIAALLRAELPHPGSLIHQPLIAARVRHIVLSGLLLSVPHRYHDELSAPVQHGAPRAIRRALNAIQDEPEKPFGVADLAVIAGMSVRSLQEGFRRHVGCAPMTYLQRVRLTRVHEELRQGDPSDVTVAAVAHRWGFAHLGRFASVYRGQFGESPSETLRRVRL
jgi:AraC-like DNA-binding protein